MSAFFEAMVRSASATSGRRSSRVEGQAHGYFRRREIEGMIRQGEVRGIGAAQHREGIRRLRPALLQPCPAALGVGEIGLRLGDIDVGGPAACSRTRLMRSDSVRALTVCWRISISESYSRRGEVFDRNVAVQGQ